MTDLKSTTYDLPPVAVTVIGTKADDIPAPGTIATTPKQTQPNLIVNVVTPLMAIAVRFGNDWCVSFSGAMLAGGITTKVIPQTDFASMLTAAAILATCVAGVGAVKNAATVFSGLEKRFPLASGSV